MSGNSSVGGLSTASAGMSTTKRFLFDQSACLKNGVLFLSSENNAKETGPGYYNYQMDTLVKPSHNVRAKSPKPGSLNNSGNFSPRSNQSSPRSASSPRLRNFNLRTNF
jgi:hypothetical protein